MEESEMQVDFRRKYVERLRLNALEKTILERWEEQIQFFANSGNVHEALSALLRAYASDVFDLYHIEIAIEGVVQRSRNYINLSKITYDHFVCTFCCDVIKDPVTLKCGHTFSKKCILANEIDFCEKCGMSYGYNYVPQLKNNVLISTFIETLWKQSSDKRKMLQAARLATSEKSGSKKNSRKNSRKKKIEKENGNHMPILQSSIFEEYSSKGDRLVSLEKLEDALVAYLISLSFGASHRNIYVLTKEKTVKVLHKLLIKHQCSFCTYARKKFHFRSVKTTDPFTGNALNESDGSKRVKELNSSQWIGCFGDDNNEKLHNILRVFFKELEKITSEMNTIGKFHVSYFEKREFDCPLCIRVLWEPVTTPCGHTFCRTCLYRSLDHQVFCPLCKTSLSSFLAQRIESTTELVELAIKTLFPDEYLDRRAIYIQEKEELLNAGIDPHHAIPLFICTNAYPTVPCPLHIFEPRYRLMIRQCMESGSKQFGMCSYLDDSIADYGTMLEIKDVQYFPDGRSVVNAVGSKRFQVLKTGERDGFHTASVSILTDDVTTDIENVTKKHDELYKKCEAWFLNLPEETKEEIVGHFGAMPSVEANFMSNPNGPSWFWWTLAVLPLEPKTQVAIISMTSLPRRFDALKRIISHLQAYRIKT